MADATLADIVTLAMAGDPATIWQLVAGGLTSLPELGQWRRDACVETVWNHYCLNGTTIAQGERDRLSRTTHGRRRRRIPASPCRPTRATSA